MSVSQAELHGFRDLRRGGGDELPVVVRPVDVMVQRVRVMRFASMKMLRLTGSGLVR